MISVKKVVLAAALTITMGGMGLSPAKAIIWDFSSPTGPLGVTQNYTVGGLTITADGFISSAASPVFTNPPTTPGNLFGKNDGTQGGSIENGLGMVSPPGGFDNEITAGISFIRLSIPTGVSNVQAIVNSVTSTEHFEIFGSTSATSGYIPVVLNASASDQGAPLLLQTAGCATCTFFAFFAVGTDTNVTPNQASNILIGSIIGQVPLPGALVLFGSGLVGLAALGRRKRKQLEAAAA